MIRTKRTLLSVGIGTAVVSVTLLGSLRPACHRSACQCPDPGPLHKFRWLRGCALRRRHDGEWNVHRAHHVVQEEAGAV